MPTTKQTEFNAKQNTLAKVSKAMGHPARIAILQLLMEQEICVCNDIVSQLPLAQATISQHLKVLKEADLIKGEIAPNKSCYCINPDGWKLVQTLLGDFFSEYKQPNSSLCCD